MSSLKHRRSLGNTAFDILNYLILSIFALITLYPFYYILIFAFNDPIDSARGGLYLLPRIFSVDSFRAIFSDNDILTPMGIAVARTLLGTASMIVCTLIIAYCLSRKHLLLRGAIMKLIVFTMYVSGGIIPIYMVMKWSHLTNNFFVYIIPNLTNAFNIVLFKTFIEQLPPSLDESAQIDGANDIVILFRIIAPLCTPIIATIALFNSVWHWNSWYDNYIYTSARENLMTLQYLLVRMLRESEAMRQIATRGSAAALRMSPESIRMATALVIIFPIFCAYPFVQRYFVKGMLIGAVKG